MRVAVDADANAWALAATAGWLRDDIGPEIRDRAFRICPVDTGNLRDSLEHHMEGTTLVVSYWGGRDGRSYAAYVELGHRVFHPSTGIVGPEWVQGQPTLRGALYDTL